MRVVAAALLSLMVLIPAAQADLLEGFDSLGGNDALLDQSKALHPEREVRIVQERLTSRRVRSELTLGYSYFFSGDVYLQTQSMDLSYQLHLTPRWAVGVNYFSALNRMTTEGLALTNNDLPMRLPEDQRIVLDLDPIQAGYSGSLSFFPLYGKFSLLELGVVHFDAYLTAGMGMVNLPSGDSGSYHMGGGLAFWLSQHLSARFELRTLTYEAQRFVGSERLTRTAGSFLLGYLL